MGLYKRKNSPYWWYSFKLQGHPRVHGTTEVPLSEKKRAKAVFDKERNDYIDGKKLKKPSNITIKELLDDYLRLCRYEKGYRTKYFGAQAIIKFMGSLKVSELTAKKIEDFRLWRKDDGIHELTINRDLNTLRSAFEKNMKNLNIAENPFEEVESYDPEKYRRSRVPSSSELALLLNALSPLTRYFCIFSMSSGMRHGEIRNLRWRDVDFERGIMYIDKNKEGKPKIVAIHQDNYKILSLLPRLSEWVFCDERGHQLKQFGKVRIEFYRVRKKLGLQDLRFHDLRHVFGTHMIEDSGNVKATSLMLGHSSVKTTEIYINTQAEFLKDEISKLRSHFPKENGNTNVTHGNHHGLHMGNFSRN